MERITLERAAKLLSEKDDILILMHKSPDGDAVGSGYGLAMALRSLGKRADPLCGDEIPKVYSYITDKVPAIGFDPKFIVSVDLATTALLSGSAAGYAGSVDLCIDHHGSNNGYAKEGYVDGKSASCAEIIKKLLDIMQISIDNDMANAIFTGICTDTGCFKFSNVTSDTHRIAAELMDCGADSTEICRLMFDCKSRAKIELEKMVLETMEFSPDGKVAFVCITKDMMEKSGAAQGETEGIAGITKQIEGVKVGITMREKDNGEFRISVRSSEDIDASKICALFGGGGHRAAAGCSIFKEQTEAKKEIMAACIAAVEEAE